MNRGQISVVTRCAATACLIGALIYSGLAAYCFADVCNFYADAVELRGTIIEVNDLPGGSAPLVAFTNPTGTKQEFQFNPFYEAPPESVGEQRTVLYNPTHHRQLALASPWNWIGSIVYGAVTIVFGAIAGGFYFMTPSVVPPCQPVGHGE